MFYPRTNMPLIGHILVTLGSDAADIAIIIALGPNTMEYFKVYTSEIYEISQSLVQNSPSYVSQRTD